MRFKKWLSPILLLVLLVGVLSACTSNNSSGEEGKKQNSDNSGEHEEDQVLNIYDTAEIPTMDTTQGTDVVAFQAQNDVFEGLYRLDEKNQPTPGMAETHTVSEDGLVYTFKLRDAKWSNGTPVTAHDFVYAWQRAVDPANASQYAFILGDIINAKKINDGEITDINQLGVKALDDKTLEVRLEHPTPYFLSLTTFATFLPQNKEFREKQGENYALEVENLIYNGPFVLSEWKHEEGWVYKKNPDYWDKDSVKLDQVNIKVVKDTATAVSLYETGQIDRVNLSAEFVDKFKGSPELVTYGEPTMWYFKYNQSKGGPLANVDVRKALSMAIDKQGMVDVILNNGSVVANYYVPKDFVSHPKTGEDFRENGEFLTGGVSKAKEHWEKALKDLGKDKIEIELLGGDTEAAKTLQEYLKSQLETNLPGLTVKLLNVPFKQRLELDDAMDYDIQLAGWGPDYLDAMTFADLWVTDGGHNKMGYSNPEYDKLITDAKTTLSGDEVARFEAMQKAEKILLEEDAAIGPLYQRGTAQLLKPYVKNVPIHPFGPEYSYKWAYIEGKN